MAGHYHDVARTFTVLGKEFKIVPQDSRRCQMESILLKEGTTPKDNLYLNPDDFIFLVNVSRKHYGCSMYFSPKEPIAEVLQQYQITEEYFREIADAMAKILTSEHCVHCRLYTDH